MYIESHTMSSNTSKERMAAIAAGDVYFSPKRFVDILQRVVSETIPDKSTMLYDPAAADGRLLRPFENSRPVLNGDIHPLNESVEKKDFLSKSTVRPPLKANQNMALVFNPPFSLTTSENGVVAFLNKAESIMKHGEYAIVIAPQTASNLNNILKIPKSMHLRKEHYIWKGVVFRKAQRFPLIENTCRTTDDCRQRCANQKCKATCFVRENDRDSGQCFQDKSVNTIIQVWQKDTTSDFAKGITLETFKHFNLNNLPFKISTSQDPSETSMPSFFLLRKGSGKDVGMVLNHKQAQPYLKDI